MINKKGVKLTSLVTAQIILYILYVYLRSTILNNTTIGVSVFILLELIISILIAIVIVKGFNLKKWTYFLSIPGSLIFTSLLLTALSSMYKSNKTVEDKRINYQSSDAPTFNKNKTAEEYNLGNQQMNSGNYQLAIKSYDNVLSVEPFHTSALLNQGVCYGKIGLLNKEIENYKIGIEHSPKFGQFYSNLGMVYLKTKNFKEVIPNILKAAELDKKNQMIYTINIAQAYYEMEDYSTTCYILDTIQPININETAVIQELNRMKRVYCNN